MKMKKKMGVRSMTKDIGQRTNEISPPSFVLCLLSSVLNSAQQGLAAAIEGRAALGHGSG